MEAIDMEDAMEKLDHDSKDPYPQEGSHYIDQSEHVQKTMKAISQSAAVRAKAAHDLQNVEWETVCISTTKKNLFALKVMYFKTIIA